MNFTDHKRNYGFFCPGDHVIDTDPGTPHVEIETHIVSRVSDRRIYFVSGGWAYCHELNLLHGPVHKYADSR